VFEIADTLYLVTEMTFPALRNAHRISRFFPQGMEPGLEVVMNRFNSRHGGIDENSATKALGGRSTGGSRTATRLRGRAGQRRSAGDGEFSHNAGTCADGESGLRQALEH
jgi:Flp pilus assembly CpaE family ATPase